MLKLYTYRTYAEESDKAAVRRERFVGSTF